MRVTRSSDMTKYEFCYMYRQEISKFMQMNIHYTGLHPDLIQFINIKVRSWLNYSDSTAGCDIWNGLKKHYRQIIF